MATRTRKHKKVEKLAAFFVATDGNDSWSGKLPAPNARKTDGPFATLTRARDAVRDLKTAGGLKGPITVRVRGGKYFLDQTLVLTAEDSGTQDCPIGYTAYPGEKPILSGGRVVTGWKPYKGEILQVELPGAKGGKWKTRQLFFNGKRMATARWPKSDPTNPRYTGWAFMEGPTGINGKTAFIYKSGTFPHRWAKPSEGEVNVFAGHGWCNTIIPIKAVDFDRRTITVTREPFPAERLPWSMTVAFQPNNRFFVQNILEHLTAPGEWCLDSEDGRVYFWPPEPLQGSAVVLPALDCLVSLREASWITLSGFTFTETTDGDNYHRSGLAGYGAMFPHEGLRYCGEAMHLRGASRCRIEGNHFQEVGGNAVYLEQACYRNVIRLNKIDSPGANGVCLLGNKTRHPMYNRVEDNHIHHVGDIINYTAGVFLGLSDGNVVAHNAIHDVPHHAINLATNGLGRNIIEYNDIRRVCLEIADTGGINCWMDVPGEGNPVLPEEARSGHLIRCNFISDVHGCTVSQEGEIIHDWTTRGIYLDDGSSNCIVWGNIVVRAGMGMQLHSGRHNLIENNVFADCPIGIHDCDHVPQRPGNEALRGFRRGQRIVRNIFVSADPAFVLYSFHEWSDALWQEADHNIVFSPTHREVLIRGVGEKQTIGLDEWKRIGFDLHTLVADPLFVNPERDDYRLKPGSPALRLGFAPIDTTRIGVREPESK